MQEKELTGTQQARFLIGALRGEIIVEKRISRTWEREKALAKKLGNLKAQSLLPSGKYEYIYRSPKGAVHLIELSRGSLFFPQINLRSNNKLWECWANDDPALFMDVRRFSTRKEADAYIRSVLRA